MKLIMKKLTALEIPGFNVLIERFSRNKQEVGAVISTIAIKDNAGEVCYVVETFTESENDSVVTQLDNAGFNDELILEHRSKDVHGNVESWTEARTHAEYHCIYVFGPPQVVMLDKSNSER